MFNTKTKFIFSLFFLVMFSLSFFPLSGEAASPIFNNNAKDKETLRLKNRTDGTPSWIDPVSADAGDEIGFDVYYHNNVVGTTAKNTTVRISYPCSAKSKIVSTAYISADNASTVSNTGTVNVSSDQELIFDSVAKWYPNQSASYSNIPVTWVGSCSVEVEIGDIQGCWPYQGHVVFEATLTDNDDDADGDLSCYSSTDDSIRLEYEFEDGDDVSLFRGSSRIKTWSSSDGSGKITDDGLNEDTSYTYYLRNGTSTSSTELDRVTCSTEEEEDDDAEGELSCYRSTDDSITLSYEVENGSNASIFRSSTRLINLGSGDEYGRYEDDDDLDEDESYTYYLRNGTSTSSTELDRVTCYTDDDDDDDDAWGDLECYSSTDDSIRLEYEFEDGDDVSLFRGSRRIETWSSSDRDGKITDDNLDEDESYTYYLRNGRYSSSTRLAKVTCSTEEEDDDDEEDLVVEKTVRSLTKYGFFSSYLNVVPEELISFSIKVSAEDEDAEDVFVKDSLPTRISYEGNLEVDGRSVSGDIERGISIGDIDEGDYKTVTFDAKISPRTSFILGKTTLTNTVRVTSDNDSATDSAVIYVTIGTPTIVPTGITGNSFFDYVLIPFLLTLLAFVLFRKHFIALVKKLEGAGKEMRESW